MPTDAPREAERARGDWADRLVARRWWCLGGWALAGLVLLPLAGHAERVLDATGRIPGSESAAVEEALATRFESPFARSALLVVTGAPSPDTSAGRALLQTIVDGVRRAPGVRRTYSHLDGSDPGFLGRGRSGTYVVAGLEDLPPERVLPGLRAATSSLSARLRPTFPGLKLLWTGEGALNLDLRRASTGEVRRAEARALPLSLVLLLLAFGTVVAAALPVLSGGLVIVLATGLAAALTRVLPLSITLQSVVSMLGLGLGIDYALLTVSRFREARAAGAPPHAAAAEAARRAGGTVALSGASVALGFLALLLVPLGEIRSVAIGGLAVTGLSVAVAATLLPAVLAVLGRRVEAGRLPRLRPRSEPGRAWARWSAIVTARPLAVIAVSAAPLLLLAWPASRLKTELPGGDWLPRGLESTEALSALRSLGRVGVVQEVRVLLELPEDTQALGREGWDATRRLAAALSADPRVARARTLADFAGERADDLAYVSFLPAFLKQCFVGSEGDVALVGLVPREDATPADLTALVRELRTADAVRLTGLRGARLRVGGLPAFNADYEDAVSGRLPLVISLIVGGTLVALLAGFRSLLVALKAVALNLLTVGAAFGALVLVFQEGHGAAWLGLAGATGGVFPAVPVLAFAIVFGLSMDYEVFLVARVAEARRAGRTDSEALAEGLGRTGRLITSAAAIMVAVFGAFALGDLLLVRMLGFALAVAVLLDATLVRLALGPAVLRVAGRWNWWPGEPRA
jgi:RND superfamily putative drug exporter